MDITEAKVTPEYRARELSSILNDNDIDIPLEIIVYYLYCKKINKTVNLLTENKTKEKEELLKNIIAKEHLFKDILERDTVDADVFAKIILLPARWGRLNKTTPESVINLANAILDIQSGDSVADMCCGKGNFVIGSAKNHSQAEYFGFDISQYDILVSQIKTEIAKKYGNIPADTKISFSEKDVFALRQELITPNGRKYNKIFSHYPIIVRRTRASHIEEIDKLVSSIPSARWSFNYFVRTMLEKNGKGIVVMPQGGLFNGTEKNIRQYFLEQGYIEAVITLPVNILNDSFIAVCLLILSDNPGNKEGLYMYETTSYHRGRRQNTLNEEDIRKIVSEYKNQDHFVKMADIAKHEYELWPSAYRKPMEFPIDTEQFVNLTLGDKGILRAGALFAEELDELETEEETNCYYLNSADIREGVIRENLPRLKNIPEKSEDFVIKDNSLIITKNAPYKVAYVKKTNGRKILANGNLYIITPDTDKVNPYYIKAFLESKKGMELLDTISVGSIIRNISLVSLKKMPFPMLPREKQDEIANAYIACQEKIQAKLKELKDLKKELDDICDSVLPKQN